MGKKIFLISFIISLFIFSGYGQGEGQELKEGLWEIAITAEERGEDPVKMNLTECLTNKDFIPFKGQITGEIDKECKVVKYDFRGNILTWVINCKDKEGPSTGSGKVTYKGDTFEGIFKMKDPDGEMTVKLKGKWIGKCPSKK